MSPERGISLLIWVIVAIIVVVFAVWLINRLVNNM